VLQPKKTLGVSPVVFRWRFTCCENALESVRHFDKEKGGFENISRDRLLGRYISRPPDTPEGRNYNIHRLMIWIAFLLFTKGKK
jgi:hypothetical protein